MDGVLRGVVRPPKRRRASITSRIKVMAGLNIAEKRLPQDGASAQQGATSTSASTVPTSHGERVVMRLLDHRPSRRSTTSALQSRLDGRSADQAEPRDHLGHRPDRLGEDDDLYGCLINQLAG